jgi:branched-chain amino acid transport system permease protein
LRWQPERRCWSVLCCDRATALRFSPSAIPKRPLKVRASIASAPSPAFYVLVAAATGMVGSLIYLQKARISPDAAFSVLDWSAYVIFIVIIGGVGTIEGPIVGVIVFYALQRYLADFGTWYLILLGALAIVTMLFAPKGVWGYVAQRYRVALSPVQRMLVRLYGRDEG